MASVITKGLCLDESSDSESYSDLVGGNNNNNNNNNININSSNDDNSNESKNSVLEEFVDQTKLKTLERKSSKMNLRIAGMNVRGLVSNPTKRIQLNAWLEHQDIDVICIQEWFVPSTDKRKVL